MMKRLASLFLILLVNILLLAHVVIPHHHHGNIPHFTTFNSHHHGEEEQDDCCCSHEKDSDKKDNNGTCALEQVVMISFHSKDDCQCTTCSHDNPDGWLQAVLYSVLYNFTLPEKEIRFRRPPYLINYHSLFASHSLGLRAPPCA